MKCFVLFYCKKFSTLRWCEPPQRAFRATHSFRGLIFTLLLIAMVSVSIPLGYTIVS